ncbi:MAG TPA: cytochrome c oxidase subunit 3 [Candidatus Limnocylindria bacterium]
MADRTIVRGRGGKPTVDRLPENDSGYEVQPTRFNSGMWAIIMFVGSEAMFFAALFTTYFFLRGKVLAWEPVFGEKPTWLGLPLVNTIELLASSVTMQLGVSAIKKGDRRKLIMWLVPTVILGVLFLSGQAYEYTRLGFLPKDGVFAAVFFTLTGFHGAHVTGGVIFIAICLYRSLRGQFTANRHLAVEAASIYWHFVDVVWIGLFTTIYIIG